MLKLLAHPDTDPDTFHQHLAHFNVARIAPATPTTRWLANVKTGFEYRVAEGRYLEALRLQVAPLLPAQESSTDDFIDWFERLVIDGPGQQHALRLVCGKRCFDRYSTELQMQELVC